MSSMISAPADEVVAAKCELFAQLFRSGRIDELVEVFYTTDAVLEGQGLLPQRGRQAIAAAFKEARGVYAEISIHRHENVRVSGDLAYSNVSNTNVCIDGSLEMHRGLMIWRRVEDSWLVERDFFVHAGGASQSVDTP